MPEAYLGLGSNLGDRAANLWEAVRLLLDALGSDRFAMSPLYETELVGPVEQPSFLNAVLRIEVERSPQDLLAALKAVEQQLGRIPSERWGPRCIDLDLLLYGELTIATHDLIVPHPELWNRRFVLTPLLDVLEEGPLYSRARDRLAQLGERPWVRLYVPGGKVQEPLGKSDAI
ncbi:MAG: 2-amino-4-hydroxy-6-hydroxymethyldihydropteridine diphosphokinase [Chloroflexi bacterium]|nr:2-amino-4-hydroxy-6-hydroxymethyldihydropteridine diphosphokinase [Chloroflexota bacterium]